MEVKYSYTRCFKLRVPTSTIKASCFGFHRRFPLLWLIDLDLYVLLESTMLRKSHVSTDFPMNTRVPTSSINVSCFGFHWSFPVIWLIDLDLYVCFSYVFVSCLICLIFLKSHVSINPPIYILQIACSPLLHQCVVLLMSYAFPSTLAYRFGFVCLF